MSRKKRQKGRGAKKLRAVDGGLKQIRYICVVHFEDDEDGDRVPVSEVHEVSLNEVTVLTGKVLGWHAVAMPMTDYNERDVVELRCMPWCACSEDKGCRCEKPVIWLSQDNTLHELDGTIQIAVCERKSHVEHIKKALRLEQRRGQKARDRAEREAKRKRGLYIGLVSPQQVQMHYRAPGGSVTFGDHRMQVHQDGLFTLFYKHKKMKRFKKMPFIEVSLRSVWHATLVMGYDEEEVRARFEDARRKRAPQIVMLRMLSSSK